MTRRSSPVIPAASAISIASLTMASSILRRAVFWLLSSSAIAYASS
ncbi:MAG: hypothetical protein HND58_09150 [Planctomycetota bacterium]|nr:MAG: hypothetical protein HND58_09150 [Planctomycetota bacterium]